MVLRSSIRRYPLVAFFLLAYTFSWVFWGTAQILYPPDLPVTQRAPAQLLTILGTFGPFVAAALVAWTTGTAGAFKARLLKWRIAPRWYLFAVSLPVGAVGLAYVIYRLLDGAAIDPSRTLPASMVVVTFVITLFAGGGNEEPGWRGFALPRLQRRYGPVLGTLVLAVLWAGWHIPAFFDPSSSQALLPPVAWTLGVVANSVILTWLFNAVTESVPVVALYHATFNTAGLWVLSGLPIASMGTFYWTGIGVFVVFAIGLLIATGARLAFPETRRSRV